MIEYMLQDGVRLGVYDATNSTPESRKLVLEKLKESKIGDRRSHSPFMHFETLVEGLLHIQMCQKMRFIQNLTRIIEHLLQIVSVFIMGQRDWV